MKIFYAVQGTGNGHIARATWLLPYLAAHGDVSIFLSGNNSSLAHDINARYRSKGVSLFYTSNGGLDYSKIFRSFNPLSCYKEAKKLPLESYDIILNDFEPITALACKLKKIRSLGFGHQASFQSASTPRPARKSNSGEWVLSNFARSDSYVGLHFSNYDDFIINPVLHDEIVHAQPINNHHITVYLGHYTDETLIPYFKQLKNQEFHLFSKQVTEVQTTENITRIPISSSAFRQSLISCSGMITGAGFETPAEALYLGKKLLCIPIRGQYEQWCNAAALTSLGVPIISEINKNFGNAINKWLDSNTPNSLSLPLSTAEIVKLVITKAASL
jgi:uncharacterized protein (TIGR00661 family)